MNHQKMIHASELLRHSDLTISHIAQSLGFTQMSYFSKTFKKEFEMTPKEYRKNSTS
ncbi:bacterial regulatory helix-turn-helix s, AraC family protein [Brochothrix thermosphacta DSM 20171 = FSL F6-1036]|nr:bacterial regulatory helix-turn-helix s, AraC family protein [Brochothrix thermosphacta DSM 20171 = FSL F6-1036]